MKKTFQAVNLLMGVSFIAILVFFFISTKFLPRFPEFTFQEKENLARALKFSLPYWILMFIFFFTNKENLTEFKKHNKSSDLIEQKFISITLSAGLVFLVILFVLPFLNSKYPPNRVIYSEKTKIIKKWQHEGITQIKVSKWKEQKGQEISLYEKPGKNPLFRADAVKKGDTVILSLCEGSLGFHYLCKIIVQSG